MTNITWSVYLNESSAMCLVFGYRVWYYRNMETGIKSKRGNLSIPVTLEQIAQGLRGLSDRELETLEILVDPRASQTISESVKEARRGKLKRLA